MSSPDIARAVFVLWAASSVFASAQQPASKPLAATDKPIRILYLEDQPRWDYRYIKNALLRTGDDVQAFLLDASPDFVQEANPKDGPLQKFPTTRAEFFAYDVILIGDISRRRPSMDAADQSNWMLHVMNFLDAGGGVAFLCGTESTPEFYRGTILEHVLPVKLPAKPPSSDEPAVMVRAVPAKSAAGVHPIARLLTDEKRNARLWASELAKVPASGAVPTLREGAQPVLASTDPTTGREQVVAAVGSWGRGRTFYIGTGETWRWRNPHGEKYQNEFWRNVVRHLATHPNSDK